MAKTHYAISQYIFYDLAAAHRNLHTRLNEKLKDLGVQVEMWRVLETLGADEGQTMGELAEIVLMNPPTLTKLVDRMVASGFVQRQLAPDDHRRVQLLLTKAGLALIGEIRRHVDAENEEILERLGEDNARIVREALRALS
ncbi:MAG: MarR family transcriptional regulator [Paracoccaceae bacterium]|nr:MarR family transcriptional regulator [Paracoccaceae bacterium]MDE2914697.1 MarR family transcriptional regulator [Paracoccaceae bacterium]